MINPTLGHYPQSRMRRNRSNHAIRQLAAENSLSVNDLIWPVFVIDGDNIKQEIASMPGVYRYSGDLIIDAVSTVVELGINAIAIFPYTAAANKTHDASEAYNPENLICTAVRKLRAAFPQLIIICDVALDPYTDHGHDGLLDGNVILNDPTIDILIKQSIAQAEAGCNMLAPSDMMDGRIGAIRKSLDKVGLDDINIISYAAKYASGFYGPFRDAVGSKQALNGDKRSYQMDPANSDEALREVAKDIHEGADMIMIKPGMPYLDILSQVKAHFGMPTLAYQVSGEYSMLRGAFDNGWMDQDKVIMESLICFKRAGADGILSYFAPYAAKRLRDG